MISKKVEVLNKLGLHARPAALFVNEAIGFQSEINISSGNKRGSAKSIIKVLSMAINCGDIIEITADGDDEEAAINILHNLIKDRFGEE